MKNKKKFIVILIIVLIFSIFSVGNYFVNKMKDQRKITIATAYKKNIAQTVVVNGFIEPNKKQVIDLAEDQKVIDVFVSEGQTVKKGDKLIQLDQSENIYNLNIETLNMQIARRDLERLLRSDVNGKKDIENTIKQTEIELAEANEAYRKSKNKLEQDNLLLNNDVISQTEYDASEADLNASENAIKLKEIQLDSNKNALADYEKDRQDQVFKLRSNIDILNENINRLKEKVNTETSAVIDGKVAKLNAEKDQYPTADNAKILVYDTSKYIVRVKIKQQDALFLSKGNHAKIKIVGFDGKEYNGEVQSIDEMVTEDAAGGKAPKVEVEIAIDNPDDYIRIGYEVEVSFDIRAKQNAVIVDFEAIIQDIDGSKYIYFVENNIARKRPVRTGIESDLYTEIVEGVIAGDQYVVNPSEKMQRKQSMKIGGWGYEFR